MSAPLLASRSNPNEGGPSFSLAHRLTRAAWQVCWTLLAAWTPPGLHRWRGLLLRLFGARVHPTANVYPSARIWYPANLAMGPFATIGPCVTVYCMGPITLEPYALVSQGAHLCGGTHDVEDSHFQLLPKPIVIGERAWVAAEAFVGPGVTMGTGAVLGARGVAMRDLAPWTIYSGNPATRLRERHLRFSAYDPQARR